jgi:hypothetical protein
MRHERAHFNMNNHYVWRRDFTAVRFIEACIVKAARGRPGFSPGFIFAGHTDECERKNRIRAAIIELGLADSIIGTVAGKPETYRACFERHYHESLWPISGSTPLPSGGSG